MLCKILDELRRKNNFHLLDIYAELPDGDAKPPGYGQSGMVARVTSAWVNVMKGRGDDQSTLAPPQLLALPDHPTPGRAHSLNWELKQFSGNGRSLVLIFDKCILKVFAFLPVLSLPGLTRIQQFSYLTHTSPQFLTTDMWFRSILPTTGKVRQTSPLLPVPDKYTEWVPPATRLQGSSRIPLQRQRTRLPLP